MLTPAVGRLASAIRRQDDVSMDPRAWSELLQTRGVDKRIIELVVAAAGRRNLDPPTTGTKQLLIALEPDGYAAGRVSGSVLSLFFDPERARMIAESHAFSVGQRVQPPG